MIPHLLDDAAEEIERLSAANRLLLAIDFDGTLSPIAPTPEEARIDPDALRSLEALRERRGSKIQLAIVSGRRAEDVGAHTPTVDWIVGLHGLELKAGTESTRLRIDTKTSDAALDEVRSRLANLAAEGARIEDKEHSIALHVRGLDENTGARLLGAFEGIVESVGAPLDCLRGKAVAEARPAQARKHVAVGDLVHRSGATHLAYLGDDRTDEEVFEAFPRATTIVVMERRRPTSARFWLRSPREVALFLARLARPNPREPLDGGD